LRRCFPQALSWSPSRVLPPCPSPLVWSFKIWWCKTKLGGSARAGRLCHRVCKRTSVKQQQQQLLESGAVRCSPGSGACLLAFPLAGLWGPAAAPVPGIASTAPLRSQERACSLPLRSDFAPWMHLWKNQLGHNAAVCGSEGQGSPVCAAGAWLLRPQADEAPAPSQPCPWAGQGLRPDPIHGLPSHE